MKGVIGFGSNLGDRRATIELATQAIAARVGSVLAVSSIQETPPMTHPDFEIPEQGPYLNGALLVETNCAPEQILDALLEIETELGRKRSASVKWGPRTIDLDLILVDDLIVQVPRLILPHPGMIYRDFVLGPVCELWPTWQHPIEKKSVMDLFAERSLKGEMAWRVRQHVTTT